MWATRRHCASASSRAPRPFAQRLAIGFAEQLGSAVGNYIAGCAVAAAAVYALWWLFTPQFLWAPVRFWAYVNGKIADKRDAAVVYAQDAAAEKAAAAAAKKKPVGAAEADEGDDSMSEL